MDVGLEVSKRQLVGVIKSCQDCNHINPSDIKLKEATFSPYLHLKCKCITFFCFNNDE